MSIFQLHYMASSFMPHGACYLWQRDLVWLHVLSNGAIALSYFSIPLTLLYILKRRDDVPFGWVFWLFAGFIVFCGSGHLIDIWTLWHPDYWIDLYIKSVTGLISLITAVSLFRLIPKILSLPSPQQLRGEILSREQVQKELEQSEERWQLILKGTGDGIFDWNVITNEAFLSVRLKEMLGYEDGEVENSLEGWKQLLHPDDVERALGEISNHLENRTPQYKVEYRLLCKDGSYKWILARGLAKWEDGKPVQMVGSHQDISLRKQFEAKITQLNEDLEERVERRTAQLRDANKYQEELITREQEALTQIRVYEDVVQNIPMGLSIWNLENLSDSNSFRLIRANPTASRILGVSLEDNIGKQMSECFPSMLTINAGDTEIYAEVVRDRQPRELEEVKYGDDKTPERLYRVKAFPLPYNRLGIVFEDFTERKKTQQALLESERLYSSVVNSVQEVIFQIDTSGHWSFLNAAWSEITGFDVEESINQPFESFMFSSEDRKNCKNLFHSLLSREQESFSYEFLFQDSRGNFCWLEMNAQLNENLSVQILGICGTLYDVTERKRTEKVLEARAEELQTANLILLQTTSQLEKRNKELDQFAYVTSHDLKAPLRAIASLSEWIEEDLEEVITEETQHQLDLLRGRVFRMEGLINGLLEYSRVGKNKKKKETVCIEELLSEIISTILVPPEFTVNIKGEMPTLFTHKLPLEHVFLNLIDNAIKHNHREDGKITISVEEQSIYYRFAIADNGPGIKPEYFEKIFAIFKTLHPRDKKESTGVGLSIVKKTVEAFGGQVWLESQLGQGSTFYFTWKK